MNTIGVVEINSGGAGHCDICQRTARTLASHSFPSYENFVKQLEAINLEAAPKNCRKMRTILVGKVHHWSCSTGIVELIGQAKTSGKMMRSLIVSVVPP